MKTLVLAGLAMGIAASACAQSSPAPQSPVALFREACIDTSSQRAAFEALGRDRGWAPIAFNAGGAGPDWGVGFGLGYARVMMTGYDTTETVTAPGGTASRPAHITCQADFRGPPADWRDEAEALAREQGYGPIPARADETTPEGAREWAGRGRTIFRSIYSEEQDVLMLTLMTLTDPTITLLPGASGD